MKVITLLSRESATGKSAIAVHLAHHLRDIGKSVLVIDLAYTDNTSRTLAEFAGGITVPELFNGKAPSQPSKRRVPRIELVRSDLGQDMMRWRRGDFGAPLESASATFRESLAIFAPRFDFCIVDTAPGLCVRARAAIVAADLMLIPVVPVAGAVDRVDRLFVDLAVLSVQLRQSSAPALLLPNRIRSTRPDARAARAQLGKFFQHPTIDAPIAESEEIQNALNKRMPVWALGTRSSRRPALQMRAALEAVGARIGAC